MTDAAIHDVSELALSIAWHAGLTRELVSTTGERFTVVFPGHWTHGQGPDFRDAMLERESGALVTGSVELHHRASDWMRHKHHTDPAYDDVVLHVVTDADSPETRRSNGALVPMAVLHVSDDQLRAVQQRDPSIWSRFGGSVCAAEFAIEQPGRIRSVLWQLGDTRYEQRVVRFESELVLLPPASVLVPAIFDAFGYSRNREQMRLLADRVRWQDLAPRLHRMDRATRIEVVLAISLGVSGWMPISPAHAALGRLSPSRVKTLESRWRAEAASWQHAVLSPTIWDIARVRPANHPFARIVTLASLLGSHGMDLLPTLISVVRDGADPVARLQELASWPDSPPLGEERALAMAASVVLPFLTAYARSTGDDSLEDATMRAWAELPAGTLAQPARRAKHQAAGDARISGIRQRGNQGLLYLDRQYCGPRRCSECPIARAVVADSLTRRLVPSDNSGPA